MGINRSQHHLNQLLGLTSIGVPYPNIARLTQLGVQVAMNLGSQVQLQQEIDKNRPVIVFLRTGDLPYWQDDTQHAVVFIGYDKAHCYTYDPAFAVAPQQVEWNTFLLAWSEMDYAYAIISR
jgi:uncharacterized protein YvpB